ncbi:MAG: 1-(5-phosphoribosyl)-5-[(5-phosphoribosylamino)methylideneamino]imidazole-4-carboxamide isomerase [Omnitrophica bacterium RIFCSPHIGHO2_02_FULL_51_18]|nr:MAG: 1-(5-phosphoribosyl)-5-[(5-phosphoribosylamino)methylideneamino]imidazole-4-carboxamide isomerase [Omnitrophica bacterium RIFCSPHIGHO2_02_FULL_51_18]
MIAIPAIDLKEGKVVRLLQGDFKEEKVYFEKPEEAAKHFEAEGAARIHVVDLDGALKGRPKNIKSVEKILKAVRVPVELGGGLRNLQTAAGYLAMGVRWVIFGTQACLDRGFIKELVSEFKEKAIVGVDARDGFIATDGWTKVTKIGAVEFIKEFEKLGGQTVIYTDISKDGALSGPNLKEIRNVSEAVGLDVIASGGVSSLKDLEALIGLKKKNIKGVVIGKALYENKFTLKEAIQACSQNV